MVYTRVMNNTKTLRGGPGAGELASLLTQLSEQKVQLERLLARVEEVLRGAAVPGKARRVVGSAGASGAPARKSPLDQVKAVMN